MSWLTGKRRNRPKQLLQWIVAVPLYLVLGLSRPVLGFTQYTGMIRHRHYPLSPPPRTSCHQQRSSLCNIRMSASSGVPLPHSDLAVSLDQPLLGPLVGETTTSSTRSPAAQRLTKSLLLKLLVSDVFKAAIIAFSLAFLLSLLARTTLLESLSNKCTTFWKLIKGRFSRIGEKLFARRQEEELGVPVDFDNRQNDGWERCTLKSRKKLGDTSYIQYKFELPHSDHVLGLALGQQIHMCVLDKMDKLAEGDFFPYPSKKKKLGSFSILAPNRSAEDDRFEVGPTNSNFARVLREDLKLGDEVGIRPGDSKLSYRGQYLPVTDILYIACGVGIVPVLEQVRTVLASNTASVKSVMVVWINQKSKDFDKTGQELEEEYFKYSDKLAVSCTVADLRTSDIEGNDEIEAAIPDFSPGRMAVISGPVEVSQKARAYLTRSRGFPEDCICVL